MRKWSRQFLICFRKHNLFHVAHWKEYLKDMEHCWGRNRQKNIDVRIQFVTIETTPLADTIMTPLTKNTVRRLIVGSGDVLRGWCVVVLGIHCH